MVHPKNPGWKWGANKSKKKWQRYKISWDFSKDFCDFWHFFQDFWDFFQKIFMIFLRFLRFFFEIFEMFSQILKNLLEKCDKDLRVICPSAGGKWMKGPHKFAAGKWPIFSRKWNFSFNCRRSVQSISCKAWTDLILKKCVYNK